MYGSGVDFFEMVGPVHDTVEEYTVIEPKHMTGLMSEDLKTPS